MRSKTPSSGCEVYCQSVASGKHSVDLIDRATPITSRTRRRNIFYENTLPGEMKARRITRQSSNLALVFRMSIMKLYEHLSSILDGTKS
jgi:hypothetical protein